MPARIIVLNGVSSAGKTTLARAIQAEAAGAGRALLHVEMDKFISFLPDGHEAHSDWFPVRQVQSEAGTLPRIVNGPLGEKLMAQMRHFVIGAGRGGLDCVVDEVCPASEIADYRKGLAGCELRIVKVAAPIEVIEKREKDRGDRLIGLAREQAGHLHRGIEYNAEIDTSTANSGELAGRLIADLYS
ncbi:phosphotransferase-like protein [Erythrobacter sp.]|uniref:phosphotransferase-like protein n=1 Tax=Erythrobacter sp. TaxID=1042 RepID=UPI002EB5B23F|nr:hypothetical protein [Erythrobacter sp.]